jgi:tetratricopeptide (TPR) repeat protein
VQDQHIAALKSPFAPLSVLERMTDWGREVIIARTFADELDLYRAISTYKRAEILVSPIDKGRKLEIQYDILLCYFFARRYDEAVLYFEKSELAHVDKTFPAYKDLFLILYECYREIDAPEKEEKILELMQQSDPTTAEKLNISRKVREGDLDAVQELCIGPPRTEYLCTLLDQYNAQKKSIATAQTLNALLPGAGYLYIGQKTAAFTAFLLNSLFIIAAYEFFHQGHTAGGIITTVFETGWYFGGIYGVGLEAKYYNERIYEKTASSVLNEQKLFPVLMLEFGF